MSSNEELDRDIAELSSVIDFLESQLHADRIRFSPEELLIAYGKIERYRDNLGILKKELAKREVFN